MRNLIKIIAIAGWIPLLFSCAPPYTPIPTNPVPTMVLYPPNSVNCTNQLSQLPYVQSFDNITTTSDLGAAGIGAIFNTVQLITLDALKTGNVFSGSHAIEADGQLCDPNLPCGNEHPELHIQFIVSGLLRQNTFDFSDKEVSVFVYIPTDSPIDTVGFTVFNGKDFVAIGHQEITSSDKGVWNDLTFNVKDVYDGNTPWDYTPDPKKARDIIKNADKFEINGMRHDGSGPTSTYFILHELMIGPARCLLMPVDDSVDSLRKYANQRHLLIGSLLTDPPGLNDHWYLQVLVQEFNMMIANHGTWQEQQPNPGMNGFDFSKVDPYIRFGTINHLTIRGPCLGWNNYLPDWLMQEGKILDNPTDLNNKLSGVLDLYIHTVLGHYHGYISIWDAFNEVDDFYPSTDSQTYCTDGNEQTCQYGLRNRSEQNNYSIWAANKFDSSLIAWAFTRARAADKNSLLILNDYDNEEKGKPKSEYFYTFVQGLKESGVPIDGVGFQLHIDESKIVDLPTFLTNVDNNVKRYNNDLGLQVQFTEVDVRIHTDDIQKPDGTFLPGGQNLLQERLQLQAKIYRGLMEIALRNNVKVFMMDGLTDRHSPIAGQYPNTGYAHIFDKNYQPKPAYYAILDELKNFNANTPFPP